MKKLRYLFPALLSILSMVSCNNNSRRILIDQYKDIDSLIWIDDEKLVNLVNQKKDFIIVIGNRGCLTCSSIIDSLTSYIKKSQKIIYWVEISDYLKAASTLKANETYALDPIVESASMILFDDGIDFKNISYNEKMYKNSDSINKVLSNYVSVSNYFNINELTRVNYIDDIFMYHYDFLSHKSLESLIEQKEEHTILFTLTYCPDCNLLKEKLLDSYLLDNNKTIYVFETDGLRDTRVDPQLYEDFKKKFELDSYHNGRVPSFITYSSNKKIDMSVFINDTIEQKDDEYVITDSFYKECIGIKAKTKSECRIKSSEVQYPLIKEYLNRHL